MRTYGKKFLRISMERATERRVETRDAILWDILPEQRLCRVKIQGSNQLIVAKYPENWESTPYWLKPGNAVRITHPSGSRGRIEIFGFGAAIPTPVAGSTLPAVATGPNAVLVGCHVSPMYNNPRMAVMVHVGTFRIAGTTYYLDAIAMNSDVYTMGDGGAMDDVAGAVAINAAPSAGNFRFDLISVGLDSVIDYTPGSPAPSSPAKPALAANHVALAYILVPGGAAKIISSHIDAAWQIPAPHHIEMTIADPDLTWTELQTNVILTVFDQYGMALSPNGIYAISLEIVGGNGSVWSADSGWSTSIVHQTTGASSYTFIYRRDQLPEDSSPTLRGTLYLDTDIMTYGFIRLYDSIGDLMR